MLQETPARDDVPIEVRGITFEEFLVKYDGQHAEWFPDGSVLVHMAASERHQVLFVFLISLFNLFLSIKGIGRLMVAPFSMRVGGELPTREPDVMILLNEHVDRIKSTRIEGAADIAIEIVSPESIARDYGEKFKEYEAAGVQEYWIFDPEREASIVYALTQVGDKLVYRQLPLDEQGRLVSTLLPGFALDPHVLWQDELPGGMELIKLVGAMTGVNIVRADEGDS